MLLTKKTIDSIVMRFHKTALNLIIIDFADVELAINKSYHEQLNTWGILEETLKSKEKLRLKLFHYLKIINNVLIQHNNDRNIIFYVTQDTAKRYMDILTKYFPYITHYGSTDFNWILKDSGESREILEDIKNTRFNFDYSKFTKRKSEMFLQKYKIQNLN